MPASWPVVRITPSPRMWLSATRVGWGVWARCAGNGTDANLRGGYTSWAELVEACEAWMAEINGRQHRVTRRAPVEMLAEEQHRLHALPEAPYTAVLGQTRKVSWSSTVSFGGVTYSVPHTLADETVWVRVDGERVVVTQEADHVLHEVELLVAGGGPEVLEPHRVSRRLWGGW